MATQQQHNTTALSIEVTEQDNDTIKLFVKTNKVFEDYLKATKEIKSSKTLWGNNQEQATDFYYKKIFENIEDFRDNINQPLFYRNKLNQAILRLKGISEGLHFEIKINQNNRLGEILITEDKLKIAIKEFSKLYSEFYNNKIINNPIIEDKDKKITTAKGFFKSIGL